MKKFKTGLLALALVLGVSGAFVSKLHAAPKFIDPTYDWVDEHNSNPITNKTVSFAESAYGCDGGTNECAFGTLRPDSPAPGQDEVTLLKTN